MEYSTTNYLNSRATTYIELGEDKDGLMKAIKISTSKHYATILTAAFFVKLEQCDGYSMERSVVFGNGYTRLEVTEKKRITQKAIYAQHECILERLSADDIVEAVMDKVDKKAA